MTANYLLGGLPTLADFVFFHHFGGRGGGGAAVFGFILIVLAVTVVGWIIYLLARGDDSGQTMRVIHSPAPAPWPTETREVKAAPPVCPAASSQPAAGPARFKVSGVDRVSRSDISIEVTADNSENARVKGELRGMIVTGVTRV